MDAVKAYDARARELRRKVNFETNGARGTATKPKRRTKEEMAAAAAAAAEKNHQSEYAGVGWDARKKK